MKIAALGHTVSEGKDVLRGTIVGPSTGTEAGFVESNVA